MTINIAAPTGAPVTSGAGIVIGDVVAWDGTGWSSKAATTLPGVVASTRQVLTGVGLTGGGDLSADRTLSAIGSIGDPPAASTGNVTVDATSTPRARYYMAPAGNQLFDPTAATVSQDITIIKTTNSVNKITLPATALWTYWPNPATVNTALDLVGSNLNSTVATHMWRLIIDVPNKTVHVYPNV